MLLLIGYGLLRTPSVQTYLCNKVVESIEEQTNVVIQLDGVDFEFFDKLQLEGVLVLDHVNDTMLYVEELNVAITGFELDQSFFNVGAIEVASPEVNLITYKNDSLSNLDHFIANLGGSSADTSASSPFKLAVTKLVLSDARFVMDNQNEPIQDTVMDFNHLNALISVDVSMFKFTGDSLDLNLNVLRLSDHSGFRIDSLQSHISYRKNEAKLEAMQLNLRDSRIAGNFVFKADDLTSIKNIETDLLFKVALRKSYLTGSDLGYFLADFHQNPNSIGFKGDFEGTLDQIVSNELELRYGRSSVFSAAFEIDNLLDYKHAFVDLNIINFNAQYSDFINLEYKGEKLQFPDLFRTAKNVKYAGKVMGEMQDLECAGLLTSTLGQVSLNAWFSVDTDREVYRFNTNVSTRMYNAGLLLGVSELKGFKSSLDLKGSVVKGEVDVIAKGHLKDFVYNGYQYADLYVDGELKEDLFLGELSINDEHLKLEFDGELALSDDPSFDFHADVEKIDLFPLGFSEDSLESITVDSYVNFKGDDLESFEGSIKLKELEYNNANGAIKMDQMRIASSMTQEGKKIEINSPYINGELNGKYNSAKMVASILSMATNILPVLHDIEEERNAFGQEFDYDIELTNIDEISTLWTDVLKSSRPIHISGKMSDSLDQLLCVISSDTLRLMDYGFNQFSVDLRLENDLLACNVASANVDVTDSISFGNFNIINKVIQNNVQFGLSWDNKELKDNYAGEISGMAQVHSSSRYGIEFLESYATFADSTWKLSGEKKVLIDSSMVEVDEFIVSNGNQSVSIDGEMGKSEKDHISLALSHIDLNNVNAFMAGSGFQVYGELNGTTSLTRSEDNLLVESKFGLDEFQLNDKFIGKGKLETNWNNERQTLSVYSELGEDVDRILSIGGFYYPKREKDNLDVNVNIDNLDINMFAPVIGDALDEFEGILAGRVKVSGELDKPLMRGGLTLDSAVVGVGYLKTTYFVNDQKIIVEPDWIGFDFMKVVDENGVEAIATGTINHENFGDLNFDIALETPKNFHGLNTTLEDNNVFYGKAFIDSAFFNISGYADNLIMNLTATTGKGTTIVLPFSGADEVEQSSFIQFISRKEQQMKKEETNAVDLSGMEMNFDFIVTPDAEIQLIFDETVGDMIRCRASGALKLEIDPMGNFYMYGPLEVVEGDYLFTLSNIINKKFKVKPGGNIQWNGDPLAGLMDLTAEYRVRASLTDLDTTLDNSGKRIPVDCQLNLKGNVLTPDITFDVDLPTATETTNSTVKGLIQGSGDINKQVFSLLLINRFVPVSQGGGIDASRLSSATSTELLSNQLSNWLSGISDAVDLGVNYRSGTQAVGQEVELALSTQLFDDRVTLNGSFGVQGKTDANAQSDGLVGDFDVEYKISKDGRLTGKVYNKSNDYSMLGQNTAKYTQGVGVTYQEEYDSLSELFKRWFKKKSSK